MSQDNLANQFSANYQLKTMKAQAALHTSGGLICFGWFYGSVKVISSDMVWSPLASVLTSW